MNQSKPNWQTAGSVGSRQEARSESSHSRRSTLWIDGVGGYLMLDRDDILIGQAGGLVDVGVVGDLSRQAAVIRRRQSDYFVEPLQATKIDDCEISQAALLPQDCLLQFGNRVKARLVKPHPLSSTARFEMISLHRFQPRVDGVLLLADSCILGPAVSSHIRCSQWSQDLLMFRQGDDWFFRTVHEVEVDGKMKSGQIAIESGMRLRGPDFSLSIE